MPARAPIALTPYLLLARLTLFLFFMLTGIQELSMVDFKGEDALRVQRLQEPPQATPTLIDAEATGAGLSDDVEDEPEVQARALYRSAILMEDAGWSDPVLLSWIAAITQIVGGALLLPGLLCRFWGFGLCVVVGATFTLVSCPLVSTSPTAFTKLASADFNQVAVQIGFFMLSLGILVCGGGRISLDRLIFGGTSRPVKYPDDEEYDEE